jgi:CNT family concentrative nucleoside transporter
MVVQSIFGMVILTALAWAFSEERRRVPWRTAIMGFTLQLAIAAVLLKLPLFKQVFLWLNGGVMAVQQATRDGTSFVFGYLGGGKLPFTEAFPGASFVFAFQALPLILVVSALSALFYHWKIMPLVVRGFAWVLQKTLQVGGAVGVCTAANVFVGMVEAPLFVRPYLRELTRSELFVVMTSGMATIAGTVMVLYATILKDIIPQAIGHILTASLISAPAAIMVARLMVPETDASTEGRFTLPPSRARTSMEAITNGTMDGVQLLINVVAMLIVLVALVSLANQVLKLLPDIGHAPITLQRILGYIMAPVVWLMGIPWAEAQTAGALMGTKTILNEFIAYVDLARLPVGALSPRSILIMTYALCGFANFGSLGIMIGGLCTMVPERREDILGLGLKCIVSGTLATCLTGAIAGILT